MIIAGIENGRVTEVLIDPAVYPETNINVTDTTPQPQVGWFHLGADKFIQPKKVAYFENNIIVSVTDYPANANIDPKYGLFDVEGLDPAPEAGWAMTNGVFEPITIITVAAMKGRIFAEEFDAIQASNDIYVKKIWDDLGSSLYIDLNDARFIQGVSYILASLASVPNVLDVNVMTVPDVIARLNVLIINGTQLEKYNGAL